MNKLMFIIRTIGSKCEKKTMLWCYIVFFFSCVSALLLAFLPLMLFNLTDNLENQSSISIYVYVLAVSYISITATQKVIVFISLFLQSSIRIESIKTLSQIYFSSLYENKESVSLTENTGDVTQKLNHASNDLYTLIRNLAFSVLSPFLQILFSIIIILKSGDFYVGVSVLLYAITFILISQLYNKKLIIYRQKLMDAGLKTYSRLTDCVKNIEAVRACNTFDFFFSHFKEILKDDANSQFDFWRYNLFYLLSCSAINIIFFGGAFIYTVYAVTVGEASLAHFVMISSYIIVLSSPLENISEMLTEIRQSTTTLFNFLRTVNAEKFEYTWKDISDIVNSNKISFVDLEFSYNKQESNILDGLSLTINPGEFLTITGESGSGKSTLAKLLMGLLKPDSGTVCIGGHDIKKVSLSNMKDMFYFVTQHEKVFMDTIRFNLKIAKPNATDQELYQALSLANFPNSQGSNDPKILDSMLGDEGMTLSGGQRQRLSLARLFLRNPKVIILDEITSSLDVMNEHQVITNIRNFFPESTIINISHRGSTLHYAHRVCILQSGKVLDIGTLEDLKLRSPYISRMLGE